MVGRACEQNGFVDSYTESSSLRQEDSQEVLPKCYRDTRRIALQIKVVTTTSGAEAEALIHRPRGNNDR